MGHFNLAFRLAGSGSAGHRYTHLLLTQHRDNTDRQTISENTVTPCYV